MCHADEVMAVVKQKLLFEQSQLADVGQDDLQDHDPLQDDRLGVAIGENMVEREIEGKRYDDGDGLREREL